MFYESHNFYLHQASRGTHRFDTGVVFTLSDGTPESKSTEPQLFNHGLGIELMDGFPPFYELSEKRNDQHVRRMLAASGYVVSRRCRYVRDSVDFEAGIVRRGYLVLNL